MREILTFVLSKIQKTRLEPVCRKYYPYYEQVKRLLNEAPEPEYLDACRKGEWDDYQKWLDLHSIKTLHEWEDLREQASDLSHSPKISIVVPTYNPDPIFFEELIYSVMFQTYQNWELCIVDDGSTEKRSVRFIKHMSILDSRIRLKLNRKNRGISHATNSAINLAHGEYIAFLDHDDRLSLNALQEVCRSIIENPSCDIFYSDRDMIAPSGNRLMHLFKPDWSPEVLLTMNYIFHLMVYKKNLLTAIGGTRKGFEGSQDYDLILRAMDVKPRVCHIPQILYHWRQHGNSVAMNLESKRYAFTAGVNALKDYLKRNQLSGNVSEIEDLPRGHYKVALSSPKRNVFKVIKIKQDDIKEYGANLSKLTDVDAEIEFLVFIGDNVDPESEDTIPSLLSWFQIPEIGMVTGKILDEKNKVVHGGLILKPDGLPLSVFSGFPDTHYGYMGSVHITKNVSIPYPYCFAVRKKLYQSLGGLEKDLEGIHAIMDFGLRMADKGYRVMYSPFDKFQCKGSLPDLSDIPQNDSIFFNERWRDYLKNGDPNYSKWLTFEHNDMGVSI